jgi:hypothetical protein
MEATASKKKQASEKRAEMSKAKEQRRAEIYAMNDIMSEISRRSLKRALENMNNMNRSSESGEETVVSHHV